MDGGPGHAFGFDEGLSLQVTCADQAEVDRIASALASGGGEEGPCGWVRDRFGLWWQVVSEAVAGWLAADDEGARDRVFHALVGMGRLDVAALERAFLGVDVPTGEFEQVAATLDGTDGGGEGPPRVVVAREAGVAVRRMSDVMDAIGAAYDAGALIVTAADVDAAFFDLRTGLAGELFQKATQYELRLALVLPDPAAHGPRWTELAFEHRHHHAVRIVRSRAEADAWLGS